jgi:hypothetical protein
MKVLQTTPHPTKNRRLPEDANPRPTVSRLKIVPAKTHPENGQTVPPKTPSIDSSINDLKRFQNAQAWAFLTFSE